MKTFSHTLVALMKQRNVKAADLSRMTGISKARISQYTNGIYTPKTDAIIKLARALGVDEATLIGTGGAITPLPYKKLPVIGEISCGYPVFANEEDGGTVVTDRDIDADFCLIAKGDSMKDARILSGDIVFIKKCDMVNNGEIAAVILGDEATLKRVYYYPDVAQIMLMPENPKYHPIIYTGEDLERVRILGRAVAFRSNL